MDLFNIKMSEWTALKTISTFREQLCGALYVSARHKVHSNDLMTAWTNNKGMREHTQVVGHIL